MLARSPIRSIGRLALIVLCLGLVLILALFLLPIYLDITALRAPVENILTEFVEAPVTVDEVEINLSIWPTLKLRGIEVQGSGRDDAPVFTHVQNAEIRVSLLRLLRKEVRVKHLNATNLDFHVSRPQGGAGNWPVWTTVAYTIAELSDVVFEDVTVFLDDRDLGQSDALIDRLELDIAENRPLDLDVRGTFEGLPLSFAMSGPTLTNLSPKASDFPLITRLELADLRFDLSGTASRSPSDTRLVLEVAAASTNWEFLRELEGIDLPEIGGFDLASQVMIRGSRVELSELRGVVGPTDLHGAITLETDGPRPRLAGTVTLGTVDFAPWFDRTDATDIDHAEQLPFELLSELDATLDLSIELLTGFDYPVEDLSTSITVANNSLSAPLRLQLASIPLTADVEIAHDGELPGVSAAIYTQDLELDRLRTLLDMPADLTGELGQVTVTASSEGLTIDELTANLTVRINSSDTTLTLFDKSGEELPSIFIGSARVDHRTGQPLTLSANSVFIGKDFQLQLETDSFASLRGSDTLPVHLTLLGSGASIELDGNITRQHDGPALDVAFVVAGDNVGELEAWTGFSLDAPLAYRFEGHLKTDSTARSLRLAESMIGRTHLEGSFYRNTQDETAPLVADLHVSTLDLQELQDLLDPVTDLGTEEAIIGFDMPIFPSNVPFGNAAIDLTVDRLYREPVDLTNIRASLEFQAGQLERSPFSFDYLGTEFDGEFRLDLRGDLPKFSLDLTGSAKALDEILDQEQWITEARITADRLEFSISAEGATLREIVESSDIAGKLTNVRRQFSLPESEESLELRLGELDLSGPKGEPIVVESEGFLDQEPIHIRIVLRDFDRPQGTHDLSTPFQLQAELATTELVAKGELTLPITDRELDVDLTLTGNNFSDLSSLAGRQLPNLGPYRLDGRLALTETIVALQDFHLTLGESDLQGSLNFRNIDGRPTFNIKLLSERTRSEDYLPKLHAIASEDEETPVQQRALSEVELPEISLDLLSGFDASVNLEVNALDAGSGSVEHITGSLELDRGRLLLLAQRPQPDDTVAQIAARIEPLDRGVDASLQIQWDRQPYGLLADILNPGMAQGSWGLNLALQTRGASVDELIQNLGGHIDFTDYPEDFNATILDLWGGGLLGSLMPVFDIGEQSRINCTVGRFIVDHGVMRPEFLALDATRSRVKMRGYIDLPNNYIKLKLKPRPKQRSLINLATPVNLRGPIADPSIRFITSGIAVTAFRLSLWAYTVWVDILRKPLPTDGNDICLDPEPRTP